MAPEKKRRYEESSESSSDEDSEDEVGVPLYKGGNTKNRFGTLLQLTTDFKKMFPMMMMMQAMNGGRNNANRGGNGRGGEDHLDLMLREAQEKQNKIMQDFVEAKNQTEKLTRRNDPTFQKLDALERKLELIRKQKLKEKEKGGMPKFMMYMQQNLMNQAILQSHMSEQDPTLEVFPKIVPVAVDPRKRIMPFSTNPFINFEMNKPTGKSKDIVVLCETELGLRGDQQLVGPEPRDTTRSRVFAESECEGRGLGRL